MKQLFSFFVFALLSLSASAYDFMVGGLCYNKNADSTSVTVTYENSSSPRYTSLKGALTIPDSVTYSAKTYSVTTIGNKAFEGCSGLTSVTIPNSVISICADAFFQCSGLTSVTIPNSVKSIDSCTFFCCSSLTSVNIPNSVTSIGMAAFSCCSGLTSVVIGNSVTSIGDEAFICTSLTSINIPNSVTSIGEAAFYGCSNMTSVTIGNSVDSIAGSAFEFCTNLTGVYISDVAAWCKIKFWGEGNSLLSYAHNLYLNGEQITNLTIPNSVTKIGNYAFQGCSCLTSVTIPNSVTDIGKEAFYKCSSLTSVTIPNSVTKIGIGAFQGCSCLTSVTIPNSVTFIGGSAFYNCSGLQEIHSKIPAPSKLSMGKRVFYNVPTSTCRLFVPVGTYNKYRLADQWKDFTQIIEESSDIQPTDVNGDGTVDVGDLNIIINVSLGKETNPNADVNGDGTVDVADLNIIINAMLG